MKEQNYHTKRDFTKALQNETLQNNVLIADVCRNGADIVRRHNRQKHQTIVRVKGGRKFMHVTRYFLLPLLLHIINS